MEAEHLVKIQLVILVKTSLDQLLETFQRGLYFQHFKIEKSDGHPFTIEESALTISNVSSYFEYNIISLDN